MRDFIKEQLQKTIVFLQMLREHKTSISDLPYSEHEKTLKEGYKFVKDPNSTTHLYKNALYDFLKQESNKYYKQALINDIREIIKLNINNKVLALPDARDLDDLIKLPTYSSEPLLNSIFTFLASNELPNQFDDNDFSTQFVSLCNSKIKSSDIILCLYEQLIYTINNTIINSFIYAERIINGPTVYDLFFSNTKPDFNQDEINEYIADWAHCHVTLEQWRKYKDVDVFSELEDWDLSEDEWEKIREHQSNLFEQAVSNHFNYTYKEKFDEIYPKSDKLAIAQRDLKLIDDVIVGNIDDLKAERLKVALRIFNWKKLPVQFEYILRNRSSGNDNYDIHSENSYLQAKALLLYKEYLQDFIKTQETKEKQAATLPVEKSTKRPSKQSVSLQSLTYKYRATQYQQLTDLLNALKTHNLVSQDTTLSAFRNIFSGDPVNTPVKWTGKMGELCYFIKCLHITKNKIVNLKLRIWEVSSNCFVQENGEKYEWRKLRQQPRPAKYKLIEKLADIL